MGDGFRLVGVAGIGRFVTIPCRPEMPDVVRKLQDDLGGSVDKEDAVIRRNADAVGVLEDALAPGPLELPRAIKDHIRMLGPGEDMDAIAGVDAHRADLPPQPPRWQLAPALDQLILALPGFDDHCSPSP